MRVAGRARTTTRTEPWGERLKTISGVVAPTTVAAALLYYFGYVTTLAKYAYFGISMGQLRLSTQELALQSVASVYVPLAVLLAFGLAGHLLHGWTTAWTGRGVRRRRTLVIGSVAAGVGVVLLLRAVRGVVSPLLAESEPIATTPLCLGVGALLTAWGLELVHRGRHRGRVPDRTRRLTIWWVVLGLGVLSVFWAANSFAGAYGRGQAQVLAYRLGDRPLLTLDTRERLYLSDPEVEETALPTDADQEYRYRYRNLRLLVEAGNRLFLLPQEWTPGGSHVVVVPDDDSLRVQLSR